MSGMLSFRLFLVVIIIIVALFSCGCFINFCSLMDNDIVLWRPCISKIPERASRYKCSAKTHVAAEREGSVCILFFCLQTLNRSTAFGLLICGVCFHLCYVLPFILPLTLLVNLLCGLKNLELFGLAQRLSLLWYWAKNEIVESEWNVCARHKGNWARSISAPLLWYWKLKKLKFEVFAY